MTNKKFLSFVMTLIMTLTSLNLAFAAPISGGGGFPTFAK